MKLPVQFLLAPLLLFCGCAAMITAPPKQLTFSLSYAPKTFLRPDTNTIILVNRVNLDKLNVTARNVKSLKAGAYTALKSAGEQLQTLPHVHIINLTDSASFIANQDSISVLAAKFHADYTLELTDYGADISLDGLYNDGAYYNHEVDVKFTFYIGDGRLYKDLKGKSTSQSIQPNFGLVASLFIHPTVGGNRDKIIDATKDAVFQALLEYLPHTQTINRPLYVNEQLRPMVDEILAGHFDKAYDISQPFLNGKDSVIACKAAYNLAVVYEAQGDIDEAANLAQLSMDKYKNGFARDLIANLKEE